MNKKILFFSYWYPNKSSPNFAIYVKRHAATIKHEHDLVVLAFNIIKGRRLFKKTAAVFVDENSIITHQIYIESKFNKLIYLLLPLHYFILKKYIRQSILPDFPFTILHSNILFPCAIVGHWLSESFNCRHIISEHWSRLDKFFRVSLYRGYGKKALDRANAITCVSGTLSAIIKTHTTNRNIFIVPNVIDSAQFYVRPEIRKDEAFTFIAVAHWAEPKNPFYFLNALEELVSEKKLTGIKLVMVGSGIQLEKIKKTRYTFDIDYKGDINAEELNTEFNKSRLFLHGSDFETFSVVIAEALLSGTPCIVSPVGIAGEVINASNGFIAANTVEDWKEKILKAYHLKYDSQHIAMALYGKYDLKTVGSMFDKVYSNL